MVNLATLVFQDLPVLRVPVDQEENLALSDLLDRKDLRDLGDRMELLDKPVETVSQEQLVHQVSLVRLASLVTREPGVIRE